MAFSLRLALVLPSTYVKTRKVGIGSQWSSIRTFMAKESRSSAAILGYLGYGADSITGCSYWTGKVDVD